MYHISLCFRKVLLANSVQSSEACTKAHSKQRKDTPTQTLQFHVKFMNKPC